MSTNALVAGQGIEDPVSDRRTSGVGDKPSEGDGGRMRRTCASMRGHTDVTDQTHDGRDKVRGSSRVYVHIDRLSQRKHVK
jgi:hypothetical protein